MELKQQEAGPEARKQRSTEAEPGPSSCPSNSGQTYFLTRAWPDPRLAQEPGSPHLTALPADSPPELLLPERPRMSQAWLVLG